jgi:hypothetical protein
MDSDFAFWEKVSGVTITLAKARWYAWYYVPSDATPVEARIRIRAYLALSNSVLSSEDLIFIGRVHAYDHLVNAWRERRADPWEYFQVVGLDEMSSG